MNCTGLGRTFLPEEEEKDWKLCVHTGKVEVLRCASTSTDCSVLGSCPRFNTPCNSGPQKRASSLWQCWHRCFNWRIAQGRRRRATGSEGNVTGRCHEFCWERPIHCCFGGPRRGLRLGRRAKSWGNAATLERVSTRRTPSATRSLATCCPPATRRQTLADSKPL